MKRTEKDAGPLRALLGSWFVLTPDEQKALAIVVALFLLGLGVRFWHLGRTRGDAPAETAWRPARP